MRERTVHVVPVRWRVLFYAVLGMSAVAIGQERSLRGGVLDRSVNSAADDYAPTIVYGANDDTLFFTSSRPVPGKLALARNAEIFYSTRSAALRDSAPNAGWGDARRIVSLDSSIAAYTRGAVAYAPDSSRIIFAAEHRLAAHDSANVIGRSFFLQLWEMRATPGGFTEARELESLRDTNAWNSQPALSTDGRTLYFVSNRAGGAGGLDIWYSRFDLHAGWSAPLPVPGINTPGDEMSPHCGGDGKFYFASNWDAARAVRGATKQEIYRCEFARVGQTALPGTPRNIDSALRDDARRLGTTLSTDVRINSDGNDAFPCLARSGSALYFASDRSGTYDLYAVELPRPRIYLVVRVRERTVDSLGRVIVAAHDKRGFPVTLTDSTSGAVRTVPAGQRAELDPDRTYSITIDAAVQDECYNSRVEGVDRLVVRTKRAIDADTTFLRDFLISRRPVSIPPVVFYSTDTLPYFITGYWWPNTTENLRTYRRREADGFFDRSGFVDSSGHDYAAVAPRIDSIFADQVYAPLRRVLTQFQRYCGDTLYLKVTVHGYTDPRQLSSGEDHAYRPAGRLAREYPDSAVTVGVDANGEPVAISRGADMWRWKQGVLPDSGEHGNVLLSKLRAWYTFATFDREMLRASQQYEALRRQGRVLLDAEGFGIDTEGYAERNKRDDPTSRRIEIYLDVLRKDEITHHRRVKGGAVKYVR